ncbi:MAG: LEA type 2 family protein [Haloplanus sp.]
MSPAQGLTARRLAIVCVVALLVVAGVTFGPSLGAGGDGGDSSPTQRSAAVSSPAITGVDSRISRVNRTATAVESDVRIRVPPEPRRDTLVVDYAVELNDVRMATAERRVSIAPGNRTVPVTARIPPIRITPWWMSHVRNGERTEVTVDAAARYPGNDTAVDTFRRSRTVETEMLSGFNSTESRPIGRNVTGGRALLFVEKTSARWKSVDPSTTWIEIRMVTTNPNSYPVSFYEFGYEATMNGVEMGESVSEARGVIPPHSNRTIRLMVTLDHARLDEWWRTHLERGETTRLRISFSTRVEGLSGVVELPLDSLTYTRRVDTSMFVNETR